MRKTINEFLITGISMLSVFVGFIIYALSHPEASFPWNNAITYALYIIWLTGMAVCFIIGIAKIRKNR